MTFATLEKQFNEINCQLVGLSVDGLYSHIAGCVQSKRRSV